MGWRRRHRIWHGNYSHGSRNHDLPHNIAVKYRVLTRHKHGQRNIPSTRRDEQKSKEGWWSRIRLRDNRHRHQPQVDHEQLQDQPARNNLVGRSHPATRKEEIKGHICNHKDHGGGKHPDFLQKTLNSSRVDLEIVTQDCPYYLSKKNMIDNGLEISLQVKYLYIRSQRQSLSLENYLIVYRCSSYPITYALYT